MHFRLPSELSLADDAITSDWQERLPSLGRCRTKVVALCCGPAVVTAVTTLEVGRVGMICWIVYELITAAFAVSFLRWP
jgi:hypothetical protein